MIKNIGYLYGGWLPLGFTLTTSQYLHTYIHTRMIKVSVDVFFGKTYLFRKIQMKNFIKTDICTIFISLVHKYIYS